MIVAIALSIDEEIKRLSSAISRISVRLPLNVEL
jgi:hypothetical protein